MTKVAALLFRDLSPYIHLRVVFCVCDVTFQEEHRIMELQMEEADSTKKKIDAVKARELTVLTASRQVISTPGVFTKILGQGGANVGDTPRRTPLRLGL